MPSTRMPPRRARDRWRRAREVLRDEGPRSLWWKLLGETVYRRAWVVERPLAPPAAVPPDREPPDPAPPDRKRPAATPGATGPSATGPGATGPNATGRNATGPGATGPGATGPGYEIGELGSEDVALYLDLRPHEDGEALGRRLACGERCFVARRDGRLEHVTWVAFGSARIDYLSRTLPLAAGEAYACEAYTRPAARGGALSVAVADAMAATLRREGFRRLLGVVMPENRAGVVSSRRWGYRPIAIMRSLRLGPWHRHFGGFTPSPRQARRLARTVWRATAPPPAPSPSAPPSADPPPSPPGAAPPPAAPAAAAETSDPWPAR